MVWNNKQESLLFKSRREQCVTILGEENKLREKFPVLGERKKNRLAFVDAFLAEISFIKIILPLTGIYFAFLRNK
jgi:hypothetical protein